MAVCPVSPREPCTPHALPPETRLLPLLSSAHTCAFPTTVPSAGGCAGVGPPELVPPRPGSSGGGVGAGVKGGSVVKTLRASQSPWARGTHICHMRAPGPCSGLAIPGQCGWTRAPGMQQDGQADTGSTAQSPRMEQMERAPGQGAGVPGAQALARWGMQWGGGGHLPELPCCLLR